MRLVALTIAAALSVSALSFGSNSDVAFAASKNDIKKSSGKVGKVKSAKLVKVQPGDSLSSIATANATTIQRLFDANTKIANPDLIYPGDDLRIPSADEQLPTRPFPVAVAPAPVEAPSATPQPQSQAQAPVSAPVVAGGGVWDQLAMCEAGGNWAINTGNGFYGGLQFTLSSWQAVGGTGLPNNASREEQIMRGQALQAIQGWGAWPACSSKLGLR